ncbi:MAG TPA: PEP-CTERM sorting domain-containing protein [Rhodocyclaceae bacterium]|nr:PEP-CTERM sorting domain-containing protein [Rhodocyclaceae bacterium]
MSRLKQWAAGLALCAGLVAQAHATVLVADGNWNTFDVDDFYGTQWIDLGGDALSFDFSVAAGQVATLTVVDGGFAGDVFKVFNGATLLGASSAAINSYPDSLGLDFDAALADARYSRAVFTLAAGEYSINGEATTLPLGTTVGAVQLAISDVPEPSSLALLTGGLLMLTALRRSHRDR